MNNIVIYLLEDCEEDQYLFEKKVEAIESVPFKLQAFKTLAELKKGLTLLQPDILVTDLNLPECIGLDTLLKVKKMAPNSPIVILTGCKDDIAVKAIQLGAQDYIEKSDLRSSVLKRTLLFAKERFIMHKTLEELAIRDKLTKLYNREAFDKKIVEQFEEFKRHNISFAIVYIDLNHFKQINDEFGHLVGDKLLKLVAGRISTFNRVADFSARIGGDEFVVIASHIQTREDLERLIDFKRRKFCGTYVIENIEGEQERVLELDVSMSFGGAIAGLDGNTPDILTQCADKSMYQDKKKQK